MVTSKPINHNNPNTAKTHKKRRGKRRKSKRHKKSGPMPTISKKKEDTGGPVDEKGNPFPIDNPEGGDPICPGGFKIDYDFDPLNDPINPLFRCISSLKDSTDGIQNLGIKNITNNDNDNDNDTSNEFQTDDEDTIRGGRGGGTKKYKHTSYSKTRRRYRKHQ